MRHLLRFPFALLLVLITERCDAQSLPDIRMSIEHDWSVSLGDKQFGIVEVKVFHGDISFYNPKRFTTIYCGGEICTTHLSAWKVLGIITGILACLVAVVVFAIKLLRKREADEVCT